MLSKSLIQFFGWSVGLCSLPFIYLGPNHWLKNPNIFLPSSGRLQEKNTNRWLGQYLPHGFRDSPHLFGQVLNWDLLDLDLGSNGKIQPHLSTENWIKDLLSMAPPIRTRPSFSLSKSIPSGSFRSLLSFSIRGQTDWKPQLQKTNRFDYMNHNLV